jgi:WD40 repeat protein
MTNDINQSKNKKGIARLPLILKILIILVIPIPLILGLYITVIFTGAIAQGVYEGLNPSPTPTQIAQYLTITPFPSIDLAVINSENIDEISQLSLIGKGEIKQIQYSHNGNYYLVLTPIGLFFYDDYSDEIIKDFPLDDYVSSFDLSPDDSYIILGYNYNYIRLIDAESGEFLWEKNAHENEVQKVAFSHDGTKIASMGKQDGTIKIWQSDDGELINTIVDAGDYNCDFLSFLPDDQNIMMGVFDHIHVYQIEGGAEKYSILEAGDPMFLEDEGKMIVSTRTDSGLKFKLFNTEDGTYIDDICQNNEIEGTEIISASFLPEMNTLAFEVFKSSNNSTNRAEIWNISNCERTFLSDERLSKIILSPSGNKIVSDNGYSELLVWDITNNYLAKKFDYFLDWVDFDISPDGQSIALLPSTRFELELRSIEDWSLESKGPNVSTHYNLSFSPDGKFLAIGSPPTNIDILDVSNKESAFMIPDQGIRRLSFIGYHIPFAFSPDSRFFATIDKDGAVNIWDLRNELKLVNKFYDPLVGETNKIAISPNNKWVLVGDEFSNIKIWNAESQSLQQTIYNNSGMKSNPFGIENMLFIADDEFIATSKGLNVWKLNENQEFESIQFLETYCLGSALSPDRSLFFCGDYKGIIHVYQIKDGRLNFLKDFKAQYGQVTKIMFNSSGTILITGSGIHGHYNDRGDGTINIWGIMNPN